ncbi:membrane protein [Klebsiella phage K64-1]|nr:membrane protein [Klebsiella phage K64-1]QOE32195.1 putative membrane protein [Klebsiella phage Muenster]
MLLDWLNTLSPAAGRRWAIGSSVAIVVGVIVLLVMIF